MQFLLNHPIPISRQTKNVKGLPSYGACITEPVVSSTFNSCRDVNGYPSIMAIHPSDGYPSIHPPYYHPGNIPSCKFTILQFTILQIYYLWYLLYLANWPLGKILPWNTLPYWKVTILENSSWNPWLAIVSLGKVNPLRNQFINQRLMPVIWQILRGKMAKIGCVARAPLKILSFVSDV